MHNNIYTFNVKVKKFPFLSVPIPVMIVYYIFFADKNYKIPMKTDKPSMKAPNPHVKPPVTAAAPKVHPKVPASPTKGPTKAPILSAKPALSKPVGTGVQAAKQAAKKSTSSRREELLKQLKAVEDAIARKRSKMS